jgi:hypothetical protein
MKYACKMRKVLSFGLVLAFSFVSAVVPANSAVKLGDACKSLGKTTSVNGSALICTKSGSKLVWIKRSKADSYDAAFANAFLAEAKRNAAKILEDAKLTANQISSPPYCSTGNSSARASIGSDGNLRSLVFENPGICDITVRASASFRCDSPLPPSKNTVRSTGVFPLRAKEKLIFSNWSYYFPQVNLECRLLTGSSGLAINLSRDGQDPSVMTLTSSYSGNFNQFEASKRADQHLKTEKARADKVIADAKNPTFILKAWKIAVEAKALAAVEAAAVAKIESDKIAQDAGLGKKCVPGTSCLIGSTGPGGGVVFYDAGTQQSWGRYLEFAPKDWYGIRYVDGYGTEGKKETWCNDNQVGQGSIEGIPFDIAIPGTEIGAGKANTESMLTRCSYKPSAATAVRAYQGGGLSDWYLPSKAELNELCKYANKQNTGNPKIRCKDGEIRDNAFLAWHWSSSEYDSEHASMQYFGNGNQLETQKHYYYVIRPIRAI